MAYNAGVAVVTFNDATKSFPWHVFHGLCKKRLAGVHAVPQVVQTCEHRKYANRAGFSTRLKTMELVKTLSFYHSVFSKFKSWTPENLRKPALILALRAMGSELTGQ